MRPLILNLLAEEQQAEAASARDPVKFAVLIAVWVLILIAAWGAITMMQADQKKRQADQLQRRWEEMAQKPAGGTFRALKLFAEDLVTLHQRRMLLAPQLARIKDLVPESIYLTRMSFKINVEVSAAPAPVLPEKEGPKPARTQSSEWLLLRLEGMATGLPPELEVDRFLQSLRSDAVLSNQVREITLRSIGRTQTGSEPSAKPLTAQFVIECSYKESKEIK